MLRHVLLCCAISHILSLPHMLGTDAAQPAQFRVMVIGNSLTFTGDVPKRLQEILQIYKGTATKVVVEDYAVPSTNLSISAIAMMDPKSSMYSLIRKCWDVVVLQEQSQIPGRWIPTGDDLSDEVSAQTEELYRLVNVSLPAALRPTVTAATTVTQDFQWLSSLASLQTIAIAATSLCKKANVVLYCTWGYKKGDTTDKARYPDFATMHAKTTRGYLAYAAETQQQLNISTTIGPAGTTMLLVQAGQKSAEAIAAKVSLDTLLQDEKHPTGLGAYAAALSLANAITGICLQGPTYAALASSKSAQALLQQLACTAWQAQVQVAP